MKWEDTTGYSRDKERVPTTWTAKVAGLKITVTCGHIYYRGQWVLRCDPWFELTPLKLNEGSNAADAQAAAVRLIGERIDTLHHDFHAATRLT